MQQPRHPIRRKRWRRVLLALGVLCLTYAGCSQNILPRLLKRESILHAHMYWSSLLPALDLPEGQDGPIPVGNEIVDARTGAVLHQVDWLSDGGYFCFPVGGEPGSYYRVLPHHGKRDSDGQWKRVFDPGTLEYRDVPPSQIRDFEAGTNTIIKENADGSVVWTKTLDFSLGYDDPLLAGDRYILSYRPGEGGGEHGLAALDAATGDLIWKAPKYTYGLYATNGLIFGVESRYVGSSPTTDQDYTVVGLNPVDGTEAVRIDLPGHVTAWRFEPFADLIGVRDDQFSVLFSADGVERFRLDEWVISAVKVDNDYVFLTDKRAVRLQTDGSVVWETDATGTGRELAGSLQQLADGDLLGLTYERQTSGGERVTRLDATDGDVRWIARYCGGLHVSHSAYAHGAYLDVRGDWVYVVGQQSSGHVITVLGLDSGWEKRRWFYSFRVD